jgi:hypothetical protein
MELCNHEQFHQEPQVVGHGDCGGTHHSCNSYVVLVGSHIETDHSSDDLKGKGKNWNGYLVQTPYGLCNLCCGHNPSDLLMGGVCYQDKVEQHLLT